MANKITERDIYNAMIAGTIDAETLKAFAEKKIAQLDKRNASAAKRAAAKRAAGDELTEKVFECVTDEVKLCGDIVAELGDEALTKGKIQARLNRLVADGRIFKSKVKVAGEDGKSKTLTGYSLSE